MKPEPGRLRMKPSRRQLFVSAVLLLLLCGFGYVVWRVNARMDAATIIDEHFELIGSYSRGYNVTDQQNGRLVVNQGYRTAGGTYFQVTKHPSEFIASWVGLDWSLKLTGEQFDSLHVASDQDLVRVKEAFGLEGLTRIESYSQDFTGLELKEIPTRDVVTLQLSNSGLTDAGMQSIGDYKNLQLLDLESTQITNAGLVFLKELRSLEHLRLGKTRIGDEGVKELIPLAARGNLKFLYLDATQVTDASMASLLEMSSLEELGLAETHITDAAIEQLARMKSLQFLRLRSTEVSDAGQERLRKALPECRIW